MQTWGPCTVSAANEAGLCTSINNNKIIIFRHNGAIDELDMTATTHDLYNCHGQIAGYSLVCANTDGDKSPPWFMLTICP